MTATFPPEQKVYEPKGGALELFHANEPEVLIVGAAGTGKSTAVLTKAFYCADKFPGCRILLVRKTRASCTESILVTLEEKVMTGSIDYLKDGVQRANRHSYRLPNGSEIVVGGMDNPDRIMSTEWDLICTFETLELTEDDHERLLTRLRNGVTPVQQIICDSNPGHPGHWLNRRCTEGKMRRIISRHEDNPSITEEYLDKLRSLTGVRRARLYEGKWAATEGLVYPEFDLAIHTIPAFEIPREWNRYRAIDFGFTNAFSCLWGAHSPEDILYIYREIYYSRRLVQDHAANIKKYSMGERIITTIADPNDAEGRATLQSKGIHTIAAKKDIVHGIQLVQKRLEKRADGRPGLLFFNSILTEVDPLLKEEKKPIGIFDEFGIYAYPQGVNGKEQKELPMKNAEHSLDCLRYLCMHLEKSNWGKVRFYSSRATYDPPLGVDRRGRY